MRRLLLHMRWKTCYYATVVSRINNMWRRRRRHHLLARVFLEMQQKITSVVTCFIHDDVRLRGVLRVIHLCFQYTYMLCCWEITPFATPEGSNTV